MTSKQRGLQLEHEMIKLNSDMKYMILDLDEIKLEIERKQKQLIVIKNDIETFGDGANMLDVIARNPTLQSAKSTEI